MSIKIIGAGFGRTGTLSLKLALEQLGFSPCYHMMEVLADLNRVKHWEDAMNEKKVKWDDVFEGYQAHVDWPATFFWQSLAEYYPDAKVILSVRDSDRWYESVYNTIFQIMNKDIPEGMELLSRHRDMTRQLILEKTFHGRFEDEAYAKNIYENHNQLVIDTIAPERLLVFEAKEGWEPLCEFLQCELPEQAFPRVNAKDEFRENFGLA